MCRLQRYLGVVEILGFSRGFDDGVRNSVPLGFTHSRHPSQWIIVES